MAADVREELQDVLRRLDGLGARIPTFDPTALSDHEARLWLRSESARLEKFARLSWEQHH